MKNHPTGPTLLGDVLPRLLEAQGVGHEVATLAELDRLWVRAAGEPWAHQSWVITWREDRLEIGVPTPSLASRLRFEEAGLRSRLRAAGLPRLREIRVRVQPLADRRERRRHRRYSAEAGARMTAAAGEVPDPELRAALQRLARRLQAPPTSGE